MSVKIMAEVWAEADSEGGELLVLLALADYADDDGWCYPSVPAIAAKARLSARQTRAHIRNLEEKGTVYCPSTKGGAGHTNRYRITPKRRKPAAALEGGKAEADYRVEKAERRKPSVKKAEVDRQKGGSPLPPNHQEPSGTVIESTTATTVLDAPREARAEPTELSRPSCCAARNPDLWEQCLHAAGHSASGWIPAHWMPPAASLHVNRWRDELGLAEPDILAVVKAQRRHFGGDPPSSPRAFDRAMQRLAGERARPALTAIDGGRLGASGAPQDTRRQAALAALRSDTDAG